tara:strand:+ start:6608 stop:9727 length:3120 start_codon:yes stop_codon:yes gene_type:complete
MKFISSAHLTGGGTISGDVTIAGDLTVNGGGGFSYSEVLTGDMKITNAATTIGLEIEQNGVAIALFVNQDANQEALKIDHSGTDNRAMQIDASALTTGDGLMVYSNASNTSTRKLLHIINDNASATGATGLYVRQDSTESALTALGAAGSGSASGAVIKLQTADTDIVDGDYLGRIEFSAPLESSGSDAILAGAAIWAEADDTFAADNNSTELVFGTNTSAAYTERMRIASDGKIGIGGVPTTASLDIIRANDSQPHLSLQQSEGTGVTYNILSDDAGAFSIREGADTRFKIDTSGTVILTKTTNETALKIDNTGTGASIAIAGDDNVYISMDTTQTNGDEWKLFNAVSGTTSCFQLKNEDTDEYAIIATETGNIGIKAQPVSVHTDYSALQVGGQGLIMSNKASGTDKSVYISNNAFPHSDGAGWDSIVADEAMLYEQHGGKHYFYIAAATSSAGDALTGGNTLNAKFVIDVNSRISLSNNDSGTGGEDSTSGNTIFGYLAGAAVDSDVKNNTLFGHRAGNAINAGDWNVMVGEGAGKAVTDGHENVFVGQNAGATTTSVGFAVGIGQAAMGGANVTSVADGSVAIGASSLAGLTSGSGNTAVGYESLKTISTGTSCTAVGYEAGELITGSLNTVIGYQAADLLASGTSNTIVGARAFGAADGSETNSTIIGADAGSAINHDSTDGNVIIGNDAGTGGAAALISCVAIGYNAMNSTGGNAQTGTIAIGKDALTELTSGERNLAIGYQSLYQADACHDSIAIGYQALGGTDTGTNVKNIAIGNYALDANMVHNTNNIAIGHNSLTNLIGSGAIYNTFIGTDSGLSLTNADYNTGVGTGVFGKASGNAVTGEGNSALGALAGYNLEGVAHSNTLIGYGAGNASNAITTGISNVCIGDGASTSSATADNQISIGTGAQGVGDNTAIIGNSSTTDVYMGDNGTAWSQTSDGRLKENVKEWNKGLDEINSLRVVEFNFKKDNPFNYNSEKKRQGIIAQEAKEILPEMIKDDSKWLSANTEPMLWALVKAVQELSAKVTELEKK